MTHRTLLQICVELMVLNIAFWTELLTNRIVYLIIRENQIVLQPLKGMFYILLRIIRTLIFIFVYTCTFLTP